MVNLEKQTQCVSDDTHAMRNTQCVGSENRGVCAHCGSDYERRVTWQKYCSEPCRVAAYELRTGKKLKVRLS